MRQALQVDEHAVGVGGTAQGHEQLRQTEGEGLLGPQMANQVTQMLGRGAPIGKAHRGE